MEFVAGLRIRVPGFRVYGVWVSGFSEPTIRDLIHEPRIG